ncbi:MAG: hypothetical protein V1820_03365, partial [archaeon]
MGRNPARFLWAFLLVLLIAVPLPASSAEETVALTELCDEVVGRAELKELFWSSSVGSYLKEFNVEFPLACERKGRADRWAYVRYEVPEKFSGHGIRYRGQFKFIYSKASVSWSSGALFSDYERKISEFESLPVVRAFVEGAGGPVSGYQNFPFIILVSGESFLAVEIRGSLVYGFALRSEGLVGKVEKFCPWVNSSNGTAYGDFLGTAGVQCVIGNYNAEKIVAFGSSDIEGECLANPGNYLILEKGVRLPADQYSASNARGYKGEYPQSFAFNYDAQGYPKYERFLVVRKNQNFLDAFFEWLRTVFSDTGCDIPAARR